MLDRESTFAQPEIVKLLKTQFVPVAIDQAYQRRQKDTEGEFYRKIAGQSPRSDFNGTTQGFYVATANGKLLLYNNNRDPEKVLRLMKKSLAEFNADSELAKADPVQSKKIDPRYHLTLPAGGLAIRVHAKVMGGYEPTDDRWQRIFQTAVSRDNLWISPAEHKSIVRGKFPDTLLTRIARFHLVDNTRGEPTMWREAEIRKAEIVLKDGKLTGHVELKTDDGARGFNTELKGHLVIDVGKITRFDMVAYGQHWGAGRYTRNPPPGKFPLAITFTLADGTDIADKIPPQGSRGWLRGYMNVP
ncbi:MAG: hypothetical protein AAF989_15905 [Planctomycetota bacterium]